METTKIKFMELRKCGVASLLSDSDSAAKPQYGPLVGLPGALKVTISMKGDSKELYGDSTIQDVYQKTTKIELDIETSLLNIDSLPIIQGGTVIAEGVSPMQIVRYELTSADVTPPYFYLTGKWTYPGDGIADAHFRFYKVRVTEFPTLEIPDSSGNFSSVKFKAVAVPCSSNGKWGDYVMNETATDISVPT